MVDDIYNIYKEIAALKPLCVGLTHTRPKNIGSLLIANFMHPHVSNTVLSYLSESSTVSGLCSLAQP